jgi:hypothetical protein
MNYLALKLPREPVSGFLGITPALSNKPSGMLEKSMFFSAAAIFGTPVRCIRSRASPINVPALHSGSFEMLLYTKAGGVLLGFPAVLLGADAYNSGAVVKKHDIV